MKNHWIRIAWPLLLGLMLVACATARPPVPLGPVPDSGLADGVYQGRAEIFPCMAEVEVVVRDNRLVDVRVVKERTGLGGKAKQIIPGRIVQAQSTSVDAVSGATRSSQVIMEAVQNALDKARHLR
jgi:uncharacterized protein with FMN-binding domain